MATTYPNVTLTTTSTNENAQFLRSNFIPNATITINRKPVVVPDVLNSSLLNVINSLNPVSYYTYITGQQLTTQANKANNTTSTWWMIATLNGYIHPLQMNSGDIVLVPDPISAINGTNTITNPPTPSTVNF